MCSPDTPFSEVGFPESDASGINTDADERLPRLTPDELVLYFHRGSTIYRATRTARTDKFGPAMAVHLPTNGAEEPPPARDPFPASDDSRVYFTTAFAPLRLQVAERSGNGLGEPRDVLAFEPPIEDSVSTPFLWKSTLFFTMAAADGPHLWSGEVGPTGALTARPTKLPNVAHAGATDSDPTLSEDGLVLYWFSTAGKSGGAGGLWRATRATTTEPFSSPVAVEVSEETSRWLAPGFLSADYCRLYVYRESEPGSNRGDLGLLTREPPPPR